MDDIDNLPPPLEGDLDTCRECGVQHFVARIGIDRDSWYSAMWNIGNQRERAEKAETALAAATSAREQAEGRVAELEGEIDGLRVSEAFHRDRCDKLEMAAVRKLLPKEQDSFKGCCPLCALRESDFIEDATKQIAGDRDYWKTRAQQAEAKGDSARSDCERLARERDEYHQMLRDILALCDDSVRASLGPDAPLRAVKRLKADRDSYANSNFEGQLAAERREVARLEAECERMRAVFEAAVKLVTRIDPPGDWACAECRPNSDMLVAGFQCYVHRIRALTATTPGGDRE